MARYWAYLNGHVQGPFEIEQLIRVPGFSRHTQISVDDYSGAAGKWISPAEIPELARIFQKVDELHDTPFTHSPPRPAPKQPKPRMPTRLTSVPPPVEDSTLFTGAWLWVLIFGALIGGGLFSWYQVTQRNLRTDERRAAQELIETTSLPATSLYGSLRHYFQTHPADRRWEFERTSTGLYNVTLSWLDGDRAPVYAFEVNLQVNSVRGLNSAAMQLLQEGFPAPNKGKGKTVKTNQSPADVFPGAINDRRQSFEQGDFEAVWDNFSQRQRDEMEKGGMSKASFIRLQKLTRRMNAGLQQTILKTKSDSEKEKWVLIRQSQSSHPDMYIKQRWIWENNAWRLDEEEKKAAPTTAPAKEGAGETEKQGIGEPANENKAVAPIPPLPDAPSQPAVPAAPSSPAPAALPHLPGLSDTPADTH